ncbi:2OG-Fe(II) oxygenase family protein [Rhodocyclaceae bacterium SMB388]
MTAPPTPALTLPKPGERAPEFLLPPEDGMLTTFYERYCGRPAVLLLAHRADAFSPFAALGEAIPLLGLLPGAGSAKVPAAIAAMQDHGRLTDMLGLTNSSNDEPLAWLLDRQLRFRERIDNANPQSVADALDRLVAREPVPPSSPPVVQSGAAPVLLLPDVLDAGLCARLIAAYAADNTESGMVRLIDGAPKLVPDDRAKKRRDHRLLDPDLVAEVTDAMSRRVLPAIAAAFNYTVTRFEGFKIVAYDSATGGYFRRHRDNVTPDARHRRFAMSLNLDDDYDGGCLAFPEFGATLYRPEAGSAIVFSGALLHEATNVTRGRRHVLLTFLWGDEAAG